MAPKILKIDFAEDEDHQEMLDNITIPIDWDLPSRASAGGPAKATVDVRKNVLRRISTAILRAYVRDRDDDDQDILFADTDTDTPEDPFDTVDNGSTKGHDGDKIHRSSIITRIAEHLARVKPKTPEMMTSMLEPLREATRWPVKAVASLLLTFFSFLEDMDAQSIQLLDVDSYCQQLDTFLHDWFIAHGVLVLDFLEDFCSDPLDSDQEVSPQSMRKAVLLCSVVPSDDLPLAKDIINSLGTFLLAPDGAASYALDETSGTLSSYHAEVVSRAYEGDESEVPPATEQIPPSTDVLVSSQVGNENPIVHPQESLVYPPQAGAASPSVQNTASAPAQQVQESSFPPQQPVSATPFPQNPPPAFHTTPFAQQPPDTFPVQDPTAPSFPMKPAVASAPFGNAPSSIHPPVNPTSISAFLGAPTTFASTSTTRAKNEEFKAQVVKIGMPNSLEYFNFWAIPGYLDNVHPSHLRLAETPEIGDVLIYTNVKEPLNPIRTVFTYRGRDGWLNITDPYYQNSGPACPDLMHPKYGPHGNKDARVLTWKNATHKLPSYIKSSGWQGKLAELKKQQVGLAATPTPEEDLAMEIEYV
ncbi:hypothetical protein CC2G_013401 [Coprinopsis cinerea AmutBmut pab1-1]|nr:hypothetical protein CC2G_013401 [Coprinopsis cinerea AmutBmut pab1-1]